MKRKFVVIAVLVCFLSTGLVGQTRKTRTRKKSAPKPRVVQIISETPVPVKVAGDPPPVYTPTPVPTPALGEILTEAEKQVKNYQETFKNLLALETKTFEDFDDKGEVKKKTVVESEFLVYQSAKSADVTSELRNVIRVDGKPVNDSQARSEKLTAELQKTSTLESELEKIQKEGARYDKTIEVVGLTLFQGGILDDRLRDSVDFKLTGSENYQGSDVYVIEYQQTKPNPLIKLNAKDVKGSIFDFSAGIPDSLKKSDYFLRGKLWVDKQTYQIRREERELMIQAQTQLPIYSFTFDYQPSDYGILVPKQISLLSNNIEKDKDNYSAEKDLKVTFDYSKFRKTETDVKVLDDTN